MSDVSVLENDLDILKTKMRRMEEKLNQLLRKERKDCVFSLSEIEKMKEEVIKKCKLN